MLKKKINEPLGTRIIVRRITSPTSYLPIEKSEKTLVYICHYIFNLTNRVYMLISYDYLQSLSSLYLYMAIYNASLVILFWTLQNFVSSQFKTIYSFADLKLNMFFVAAMSVTLLSIAGVPPFTGFFTKITILIILLNANFLPFYMFFFTLLFFGLYFYVQNMRFLFTSNAGTLPYAYSLNIRLTAHYYNYAYTLLFFIIFGVFYLDDCYLLFYWFFI